MSRCRVLRPPTGHRCVAQVPDDVRRGRRESFPARSRPGVEARRTRRRRVVHRRIRRSRPSRRFHRSQRHGRAKLRAGRQRPAPVRLHRVCHRESRRPVRHRLGRPQVRHAQARAERRGPTVSAEDGVADKTPSQPMPREIRARMTFGDTEIKVEAVDLATKKSVPATFDFLSSR
jgi:hypothetical protein